MADLNDEGGIPEIRVKMMALVIVGYIQSMILQR